MTDDLTTMTTEELKALLAEADLRVSSDQALVNTIIDALRKANAQLRDTERERGTIWSELDRRESKDKPVPFGYVGTRNTPESRQREISVWTASKWFPTVKKLDEDISALVPDYSLDQLKQKFGDLRYYVTLPEDTPDEVKEQVRGLILRAEESCHNGV